MEYKTHLDEILIAGGMAVIVLSALLNDAFLMPIGVGSIIIGMVGLEATRIRDCIRQSHKER